MSETKNLKLFKHDNPTTNTNKFDVQKALNDNWDKIDEAIGDINTKNDTYDTDIQEIKDKNTEQDKSITDIQAEQTTQNKSIEELKKESIELREENERLKEDLNNSTISGHNEGENITIEGSAEARFKKLVVKGNSWQETRSGKNYLNIPENYTFTGYKEIDVNIPAGTYKITYESETHSGDNLPCVNFNNNNITVSFKAKEQEITLQSNETKARFYSNGYGYDQSSGVQATINELMLSVNGGEYEPYGAMPSPEFQSPIRNCGDNVNEFDSEDWYETLHNINSTSMTKEIVDGVEYYKFTPQKLDKYEYMKGQFKENTQYILTCKARKYNNIEHLSTGFKFVYTDGTNTNVYINNTLTEYDYKIISEKDKTIDSIQLPYSYDNYVLVRNIKLEQGTKATLWSRYGCGNVNFEICNENLLKNDNPNNPDENYTNTSAGTAPVQYSQNEDGYFTTTHRQKKIFPQEVGTYIFSIYLKRRSEGTSPYNVTIFYPASHPLDGSPLVLTSEYQRYKAKIVINESNIATGISFTFYDSIYWKDMKLEKVDSSVSEPTEYEPHQEQVYSFPTKSGQVFHKGDYLADDGTHHVRNTIELTGEEGWWLSSKIGDFQWFGLSKPDVKAGKCLCSHLKNLVNLSAEKPGITTYVDSRIYICISKDIKTVEQLKQYLSQQKEKGTPLIVEYNLLEEIIEPYSEEQKEAYKQIKNSKTYKGTTHIFCTDEISCEFEEEHIVDLESYINSKLGITSADTPIQEPSIQEGPNMEEPSINLETEKSEEVGGEE